MVVLVDRITKHAVNQGIAVGDTHKFLPGVQLVHYRNTGVAFNFLSGGGWLVLTLTLAALACSAATSIGRLRKSMMVRTPSALRSAICSSEGSPPR